MKLCLRECFAFLYVYVQFFRLLRKILEIVFKNNQPQIGTIIHGNTSCEPLTTLLRRTMPSGQVSKKVKK